MAGLSRRSRACVTNTRRVLPLPSFPRKRESTGRAGYGPARGSVAVHRTSYRKSAQGRSVEFGHDVLDDGKVFDSVGAHVLAVARLPEAAVGHLRDGGDVVVDPDGSKAQLSG